MTLPYHRTVGNAVPSVPQNPNSVPVIMSLQNTNAAAKSAAAKFMLKSDGSFHLVRTEASGTSVHMARSTVDNGLDTLNVGLPSPVGTSVGVGNLNTEGNALATIITLRHTTAPPICKVNKSKSNAS